MDCVRVFRCGLLAAGFLLASTPSHAVTFFPAEGFEDDVDLIVSPNKEFLVVPAEGESGDPAFLKIFDLDAAGGKVNGLAVSIGVPGWENGVDPIVVDVGGSQIVVAPTEREDGSLAELRLFRVNNDGTVAAGVTIALGDLGFEDDVDVVKVFYQNPGVVVPLERENGTAAGVLAVKTSAADFGRCTLVANVVLNTICDDRLDASGRLTGFVDGVDGIDIPGLGDRTRLAAPGIGDLIFFDFDFSVGPGTFVAYMGSSSSKSANAGGPRPVKFPGFERDVDLTLLPLGCGAGGANRVLVPVESPTGNGDLYVIDASVGAGSGVAVWAYSIDSPSGSRSILGYEEGVDVVPWCDTGGVPDDLVVVPTESPTGTDADVLLVDLATGVLHRSLEAENPGLTVIGFEKGVEPLLWSAGSVVVPVDNEHGRANLLSIDFDGTLMDAVEDAFTNPSLVVTGFERSVDPVVMPVGNPDRTLFVPVEKQDQSDADLLVFPGPPPAFGGRISFEGANPGTIVSGYERDVDPARLDKADGYDHVYVPEERPSDHLARLRDQEIPPGTGALLALATEGAGPAPSPNLYFLRTNAMKVEEHPDVYGYELGLDSCANIGDTLVANPPSVSPAPLGFDADGDNTLTMENSYSGNLDGDAAGDATDCAPREGRVFAAPVAVSGVRGAKVSPNTLLSWDSQDATAGSATSYDLASGLLSELRLDGDFARADCLVDEHPDTPYTEARVPGTGTGFYYLPRAQNLCGTGTYGPADLDAAAPCP